jgi:hypothetical protein
MTDDNTLTITGTAAATVSGAVGDVDASNLTGGTLAVTTDTATDNDVAVTTGTGDTTVTASSGDTVTIDADLLADDSGDANSLSVSGDGQISVDNLEANIDATSGVGKLDIDLALPSDKDIRIESDRTTDIRAGLLEADNTLELAGSGDLNVLGSGDSNPNSLDDGLKAKTVDAGATSGKVTINTAPIAGSSASNGQDPFTLPAAQTEAYLDITAGTGDLQMIVKAVTTPLRQAIISAAPMTVLSMLVVDRALSVAPAVVTSWLMWRLITAIWTRVTP